MNRSATLGLCKKAGKLITGFDAVKDELKAPGSRVKGVLVSSELSEKTKKEMRFFCEKAEVPINETELSLGDINKVIGKKTGILAVTDEGLYKSLI